MSPESWRKPESGRSRVFETQADEGKPTGFRRYINVIAITVPVLLGLILIVLIARSLNESGTGGSAAVGPVTAGGDGSANPARSASSTPPGQGAPSPAVSQIRASAPTLPPVAAATPASASLAPDARPITGGGSAGRPAALEGRGKAAGAGVAAATGSSEAIVNLAEEMTAPMRISGGSVQYPAIAKAAHVQGTVVLEIIISKTGAVEKVKVVSGPPLLQNAAISAAESYRYEPIPVNGKPARVRTTVSIVFKLTQSPK